MKNFIRLHNTDSNTVVVINTEMITLIDTEEVESGKFCSKIYLKNDAELNEFTVNETPEKIYEMIMNIK